MGQAQFSASSITDDDVRRAIDAITMELDRRKDPQRFWEPAIYPERFESRQAGGWTALVTLALLHAGESYQSPRLRDAVAWLENQTMEATYAVSTRAQVWAMLPDRFKPMLEKDAKWLIDAFNETRGGWYYEAKPPPTQVDNSNTQYGALALWEAQRRGVAVPRRIWNRLEQRFIEMQSADGGWNYLSDGKVSGSMTAAGLTVLFITQDLLHRNDYITLRNPRQKRVPDHEAAIERGLKWFDANFTGGENPGNDQWFFYYAYGVERVALASGYRSFGGKDWFREDAAEIMQRLIAIDPATGAMSVHENLRGDKRFKTPGNDDLAFSLLFLSRGRVPVAVNKLSLKDGSWNNRPRDVANATSWLTEKTETSLNWQIVNADDPIDLWLSAPMLYLATHLPLPWLAGREKEADAWIRDTQRFLEQRASGEIPSDQAPPPRLTVPELDRLRNYIDRGGMLCVVCEGTGTNVLESVERIGRTMYPQYEWRTLPADHDAYRLVWNVGSGRPNLRAISNGVRELIVVLTSPDVAKTLHQGEAKPPAAFESLGNLYLIASEMNRTRSRLAEQQKADQSTTTSSPATIVRTIHRGNWKPEPHAMERFAAHARLDGLHVQMLDRPLSSIGELNTAATLVTINGVDRVELTESQLEAIGAFARQGGTILVETVGGRSDFTRGVEDQLATRFGWNARLLPSHPIVTGRDVPEAKNLSKITYRPYSLTVFGTAESAPRLRGIEIEGRIAVVFSDDDLSHAMLGQLHWGVSGYDENAALGLLTNIVRYAIMN